MPMNLRGVHWVLGSLNLKTLQLIIYDSLGAKGNKGLGCDVEKDLLSYWSLVVAGYLDRFGFFAGRKYSRDNFVWKVKWAQFDILQTPVPHGTDNCGVFCCMFLEQLSRGERIHCDGLPGEAAHAYRMYMARTLYQYRMERNVRYV